MTTSGTYSFSISGYDIVRQAMLNIQRLDADEAPTASEAKDCLFALNMMCKQWMARYDFAPGLKVWTRKRGHVFLSGTTGAMTIGPGSTTGWTNDCEATSTTAVAYTAATSITVTAVVAATANWYVGVQLDSGTLFWTTATSVAGLTVNLAAGLPSQSSSGSQVFMYQTTAQNPQTIESAILRDDQYSDTPLRMLTVQDYDYLPNKADVTNSGDPSAIYFERGISTSVLYLDVGSAQDVSKHVVLTYLEPVQDFANLANTPYYPQEWYLALCWGLSEQIAPMFRANWSQKMEALKLAAVASARQGDPERSSLYFQPGAED